MRRNLFICLLLAGITLFAFWPVGNLGFIVLDDPVYVSDNPNVQHGFTADSITWAFSTAHTGNWHPVTWLSHMLDYQLFGPKAAGHHWMNLALHIANTLLLFIVLGKMTALDSAKDGGPKTLPWDPVWGSALIAALFALHPLRIESVAWISERKDVLSAFFFLLTLLCYATAVARGEGRVAGGKGQGAENKALTSSPDSPLATRHPSLFYWLAVCFFALGLMSKPMLVTLPVILLLLDFWPLGRISEFGARSSELNKKNTPQLPGAAKRSGDGSTLSSLARRSGAETAQPSTPWRDEAKRRRLNHLLLEKLPFVALSLASCIVTVWAQGKGGAISDLNHVPLDARIENVLMAYVAYLGQIFWPANLSIFYPYVDVHSGEILGLGLLAGVTAFCLWRVRSEPYLLVGWCWFIVMLVPVIGIVQVGRQFIADRYTYLPCIGLFLMLAWAMAGLASISRLWRVAMTLIGAGLLLACALDTRYQLRYWKDSITLFRHSIEVTQEGNCVGYWILGNAYLDGGNLDAAARSYESSIQIAPDFEEPHYQLGYVLIRQGKFEAAEVPLRAALQLQPDNADAHASLGYALVNQRKYPEGATEYSTALALRPNDQKFSQALALATVKAESETALTNFYEMLKQQPTPEIHVQIAAILTIQGRFQEAVEQYLAALQLKPDSADVLNNLAWLLATCSDTHVRNGAQAVKHAERACELTHSAKTMMVGTLAAAYAEAGRFDEADLNGPKSLRPGHRLRPAGVVEKKPGAARIVSPASAVSRADRPGPVEDGNPQ